VWTERMLGFLPLVLLIVFIFLPAVSRSVFSVWDCQPYKVSEDSTVFYMRRDPSMECSSGDHAKLVAAAIVFVFMWPIGMQLFLFVTLWVNRKDLRLGRTTAHTRATHFLTGGYKNPYYYWETVELFRRLMCTGFIILIPYEYIFLRIAIAVFVSVPVLVITAIVMPLRRFEDNCLSLASQSVLILAYSFCAAIRVANTEAITDPQKVAILGFSSPAGMFRALAFCFIVFLIFLVGTYAYKFNELYATKIRKRGEAEAQESATWLLLGASVFGGGAMAAGGALFGLPGGIVGGCICLPVGAGLGALAQSVVSRMSSQNATLVVTSEAKTGQTPSVQASSTEVV